MVNTMNRSKWKIGIITLGIVLIALGILFVLPQFTDLAVYEAVRLWPVILILLGLEVICYMLFSHHGEQDNGLHFSGGSIAILSIITVICIIANVFLSVANAFGINRETIQEGHNIIQEWFDGDWEYWDDFSGAVYSTASKDVDFQGNSLKLDIDATRLTVVQGDGPAHAEITVESQSRNRDATEFVDKIQITENSLKTSGVHPNSIRYIIKLTVPKDQKLEIDADACSLVLTDVTLADTLVLDADACSVELTGLTVPVKLDADASSVTLKRLSGDLDLKLDAGTMTATDLSGVMTGDFGVGNYTIDPVQPLKSGWKLEVSESSLDFTVPQGMDGAMSITGSTSAIDTDKDLPGLKADDFFKVDFKSSDKPVVIEIKTRNAYLDLSGMNNL